MRDYRIQIQRSGHWMLVDHEDFLRAKDVLWYKTQGGGGSQDYTIHTRSGVSFEDYVGIAGARKANRPLHDMRRLNYDAS